MASISHVSKPSQIVYPFSLCDAFEIFAFAGVVLVVFFRINVFKTP